MAQPDFQLYPTFDLANSNQVMSYYYRNGRIYVTNGDFRDELKEVVTSNSTGQRRATRIIDPNGPGTTYTTSLGNTITVGAGEQLWLNHNYTGNSNFNSRTIASINDSWWYDVDQHREFRVWLVLGRDNTAVLDGTTYYNWKVTNAVIEYNEVEANASSGTFRFSTVPQDPVTVEGTLHIESSNATWPTFSAILYKGTPSNLPGSVLATETINRSSAVDEDVTVSIELDPVQISVNDTITLAAQVDGTSGQIATIASPLRVTSYELSVTGDEGEYTAGQPVVIGGLGTSLDVSDDCDPLLNNVGGYRANERVQIIEYSESEIGSGSLTPFNLDDILSGSAQKASVPESYYTSEAINRNRYRGSKFTKELVNSRTTPSEGYLAGTGLIDQNLATPEVDGDFNFPNVEIKDTYIGYFNQIIDPYPVLNGKTAYFVKYLINDQSRVQDPSLSELGNLNFINTFKSKDINNLPAEYLPSIPNDVNQQELLELRNTSSLFRIGEYPHPVLWSQTSATTYTDNLPLTGSQDFFSATEINIDTYVNLAFRGSGNVSPTLPSTAAKNQAVSNIGATPIKPENITYIGADNLEIYDGQTFNIPAGMLTDSYNININFEWYSTSIPVIHYDRTSGSDVVYRQNFFTSLFRLKRGGQNVRFTNPRLSIYHETISNAGATPSVTHKTENRSLPLNTSRTRGLGGIASINSQNELLINYHCDINETLLRVPTANYDPENGNRIRWVFNCTIPTSQIQPGDYSCEFEVPNFTPYRRNDHGRTWGAASRDDRHVENRGWSRTILPNVVGGSGDQPRLTLTLLGSNTAATETVNQVFSPYWSQTGVSSNQITLISEHLNTRYASNFYQGSLLYTPTTNPIYPASQEPSFTTFPGATDQFEVFEGDEIRFENNENETYIIKEIIRAEQLILTLDRDVTSTTNLDFFLIRRYKESGNMIILNQQKPYSYPATASSSPGLLLPEFVVEELETNPDAVITNLIERNLI